MTLLKKISGGHTSSLDKSNLKLSALYLPSPPAQPKNQNALHSTSLTASTDANLTAQSTSNTRRNLRNTTSVRTNQFHRRNITSGSKNSSPRLPQNAQNQNFHQSQNFNYNNETQNCNFQLGLGQTQSQPILIGPPGLAPVSSPNATSIDINEVLDEKERVIYELSRQNEMQMCKIEELTNLLEAYEAQEQRDNERGNGGRAQQNAGGNSATKSHQNHTRQEAGANQTSSRHPPRDRSERAGSCVLKSTASKVKLFPKNNFQMGPISVHSQGFQGHGHGHDARHVHPNAPAQPQQISVHTSSSGTSTILPPLNGNNNNIMTNQLNITGSSQESALPVNVNVMPQSKKKTRIEINKLSQQRRQNKLGEELTYGNVRKRSGFEKGEEAGDMK